MTPDRQKFIQAFAERECGFVIKADDVHMVERRLAPVARRFGCRDIDALVASLMQNRGKDLARAMAEALLPSDTSFFRDRQPFVRLAAELPALLAGAPADKRFRIWSAGTGSGQEAYSIAMTLAAMGETLKGRHVSILATDYSESALNRAAAGAYTHSEAQLGLSARRLAAYFEQDRDRWRVRRDVRDLVRFERFNLVDDYAALPRFDVIFCRYVLRDMTDKARAATLAGIAGQLQEGGLLFLSPGDVAGQAFDVLDAEAHVYRRRAEAVRARA